MQTPPPNRGNANLDVWLRIERYNTWSIVTIVAALLLGLAVAAVVARAGAQGAADVIFIVAAGIAVLAFFGWVITTVMAQRAVKALDLHEDVIKLMDQKRWDEAIAKLEVLQTAPDPDTVDEAWNLLAEVYAATGRNSESEELIRRSIEHRGESNETLGEQLACLGVVVRRQGRIEEAEEIMARSLDLVRGRDPEATVFVLRNVAYLYWVNGEEDRARQIYYEMPECDLDQLDFLTAILKAYAEPALPEAPGR